MYDNVCMRNLLLRAILAFAAVQLVSSTAHTTPAPTPTPQPAVLYLSISDSQMKAHIQGHVHKNTHFGDESIGSGLIAVLVLVGFAGFIMTLTRSTAEKRLMFAATMNNDRAIPSGRRQSADVLATTGSEPMPRMV